MLFIPDAVFVFDRKVLRWNGQISGPPIAIGGKMDGILLVPIVEGVAAAKEANRFFFVEQGCFDLEYVRIIRASLAFCASLAFRSWSAFSGWLVMRQQGFAEGRGVEDILIFAGIIPGIDDLDFGDPRFPGGSRRRSLPPSSVRVSVLTFEDIVVDQGLRREDLQGEAAMPEFTVDIL